MFPRSSPTPKFAMVLSLLTLCGCGSPDKAQGNSAATALQSTQAQQLKVPVRRDLMVADGIVITFIYIPTGEFSFGSPPDELGRDANDLPQHKYNVNGFYISETPVTQMQYSTLLNENPSTYLNKDFPLHMLTYDEAEQFCKKLSAKSGETVRLPTEIEWEYACRAGAATAYSNGADEAALDAEGWYARNATSRMHPVKKKAPNAWQLYDMHGDVWEWCSDCSEIPLHSGEHALRGGSWMDEPQYCRAASRVVAPATFKNINVGFRVVLIPK